jgi:hypothetical protein
VVNVWTRARNADAHLKDVARVAPGVRGNREPLARPREVTDGAADLRIAPEDQVGDVRRERRSQLILVHAERVAGATSDGQHRGIARGRKLGADVRRFGNGFGDGLRKRARVAFVGDPKFERGVLARRLSVEQATELVHARNEGLVQMLQEKCRQAIVLGERITLRLFGARALAFDRRAVRIQSASGPGRGRGDEDEHDDHHEECAKDDPDDGGDDLHHE